MKLAFGLAAMLASSPRLFGLPAYVTMVPNGGAFLCDTCHSAVPNRNSFGLDFAAARRLWSPTLAAKDSDGDGFSNGTELGDPLGTGVPTPGAVVFNPGNLSSHPAATIPVTISITSPPGGSSFGAPATFTVTSKADPIADVAKVDVLNGTTILASTTIQAGVSDLVSTPIANLAAGNYSLIARATAKSGALTLSAPVSITVTNVVIPPPPLEVVTVTATDALASEVGPNPGQFRITRSGPGTTALTVKLSVGGTATGGQDFTTLPASVLLAAGTTSATLAVQPINNIDSPAGTQETVILQIVLDAAYTVGSPASATVTIADTPVVAPTIAITSPLSPASFGAPASFTVVAKADPIADIAQVDILNGTTVIASTTVPSVSSDLISTPIAGLGVGNYSLTARAVAKSGAFSVSAPLSVTVTNVVIPPPPTLEEVTVIATDAVASEAGTDPGRFTIIRAGPATTSLTVHFQLGGTAINGQDYAALPSSVELPAGKTSATLAILPKNDGDAPTGIGETVILQLVADAAYELGTQDSATVTIADAPVIPPTNEPPLVVIVEPVNGKRFRGGESITIKVRASDPEGRVERVELFANTKSLGLASSRDRDEDEDKDEDAGKYELKWSRVRNGTYTLVAVATDNVGATTLSSPVTIRVGGSSRPGRRED